MKYISTRGCSPQVDFAEVVLGGLAADGGLYMPQQWPRLSDEEIQGLVHLDYAQLASYLLGKFAGEAVAPATLQSMARRAYCYCGDDGNGDGVHKYGNASDHGDAGDGEYDHVHGNKNTRGFSHKEIVPLRCVEPGLYLLELYHGPTLAFKDLALQLLGQLLQHFLSAQQTQCTVIGATSGDTGSAAISALRGLPAVQLFMLHPEGRVSEAQRRQMTTVTDANIHNLAVTGSFDDCQAIVKALFADESLRARLHLTAVNSINWARIAAQIVYYFYAALRLRALSDTNSCGDSHRAQQGVSRKHHDASSSPIAPLSFAVPTGNFGNVFAGYAAAQMGLPVARLIIGCNRNDILARFFATGEMRAHTVVPTMAPSMDIQVASNFERYLFEMCERDAKTIREAMCAFHESGAFRISASQLKQARQLFSAHRIDDAEVTTAIQRLYEDTGLLVDPHTIIGLQAARRTGFSEQQPVVALATAHPAKFAHAITNAIGHAPPSPAQLQGVMQSEEHLTRVPNDVNTVRHLILKRTACT